MDSVEHCCPVLCLSNNVPLGWFREVWPPRWREGPTSTRSSGRETSCTETLGPRGKVVAPLVKVWPPTSPSPNSRMLLLALLTCCHVREDTEDCIADLVRLGSKLTVRWRGGWASGKMLTRSKDQGQHRVSECIRKDNQKLFFPKYQRWKIFELAPVLCVLTVPGLKNLVCIVTKVSITPY